MNYLSLVPSDVKNEIYLHLDPKSVLNIIQVSKDNVKENFYFQYIERNIDPIKYGLDKWSESCFEMFSDTLVKYNTWFKLLKLLTMGIYLKSQKIIIFPCDTYYSICNKINKDCNGLLVSKPLDCIILSMGNDLVINSTNYKCLDPQNRIYVDGVYTPICQLKIGGYKLYHVYFNTVSFNTI